jgi:hypothetical protein
LIFTLIGWSMRDEITTEVFLSGLEITPVRLGRKDISTENEWRNNCSQAGAAVIRVVAENQ